jgi:hypothetical protein
VANFIATMAGAIVSATRTATEVGSSLDPSTLKTAKALDDVAGVVSGVEVLLGLAAALLILLRSVLLRVLVLGPVLGGDGPVTELALKEVRRLLLAGRVGVDTDGVQAGTVGTRHLEYEDEVEF